MPTGCYVRRFESDQFKPPKEVRRVVAMYNWLNWLNESEKRSIKHKMNNGNEKRVGPYLIDGYDSQTGELFEFLGWATISVLNGRIKIDSGKDTMRLSVEYLF